MRFSSMMVSGSTRLLSRNTDLCVPAWSRSWMDCWSSSTETCSSPQTLESNGRGKYKKYGNRVR